MLRNVFFRVLSCHSSAWSSAVPSVLLASFSGNQAKGRSVSIGVPWHFRSCLSFCSPLNWLCHKPCLLSWPGAGCGAQLKPAVFAEAPAAHYGIKRLLLASPMAQPRCRSFSQRQQLLPLLFSDPQQGAASSVQELFCREMEFSSS